MEENLYTAKEILSDWINEARFDIHNGTYPEHFPEEFQPALADVNNRLLLIAYNQLL